ncbi:hypothetical protein LGV61_04325 [Desulfurispirillum indicum]|uniref:Uncharacterized protein n=1 Tax=Desulfurispirillum indicum (strain ATCC BAA-1389 / DSM 22839 / S5) TaxID=653733 RepID=E6W2S1_DESIS|nr:hypothetical protein [Desulfurispirillum indicum]ADU65655.1 hypothetical protein Selin_0915 [Desulfurispirillum indicum S5]UCZ57511.1 hypothetical protein LGV61_04325 [Desulfurispirillum indicum]
MDFFRDLEKQTRIAQKERDFPDFLTCHIETILQKPEEYAHKEDEIILLTEQIALYETYAQTGYLGRGMTAGNIKETLKTIFEVNKL